jgi:4-hydroxybenzoate polyprenyltransferase
MSRLRIPFFLRVWRKTAKAEASLLGGPDGVDPVWYRNTYPDLNDEVDPIAHYADQGWREGRNPNAGFSTTWYLTQYPDVVAARQNPLLHYLQYGRAEGRRARPPRTSEPPAAELLSDPAVAALLRGARGVDPIWYQTRYPDIESDVDPVFHYVSVGWRQGKDPNAHFSTTWYVISNREVAEAGLNPLLHYLEHGRAEGKTPQATVMQSVRASEWWILLSPMFAALYATAYQLKLSILSLWPQLLLALAAIVSLAGYVSLINDLTDREQDVASGKVNHQVNMPRGVVTVLFALCIVPGALIAYVWRHDAILLWLYLAAWISFSLYSIPPFRLKVRGVFGAIADTSGARLFPTMLLVVLTYRSAGRPINPIWFASVAVWVFCYGLRQTLFHQVVDIENDHDADVRTFAQRHGPIVVQRSVNWLLFPLEVAAFAGMLWLSASFVAWSALVLYALLEWWRTRLSGVAPVTILSPEGSTHLDIHTRQVLFRFYELLLPLAFLIASCTEHPWDGIILLAHLLIFTRGPLRREVEAYMYALEKFLYPPLPMFSRSEQPSR